MRSLAGIPCTVHLLKLLWMDTTFAGPTEKFDHESEFDNFIWQLRHNQVNPETFYGSGE